MERSFHREIESLKLGKGEVFHGEGILAVTKALLQSGVSYVGGYQGAPVSHLIDVMVQARDYLGELGVHVEPCTNEASAAAMLSASIMYPVRGAVTWKSIVGTNVASDALSNLASPGVRGGALIVVGEDYGEGASVVQERTHAFAMKSALWLMDPRPDLESLDRCVEKSFELSEASGTPVMLDLRIRACHLQGSFVAGDNVAPAISMKRPLAEPAPHDYGLISHPPSTYAHERRKYDERMPAARRFIVESRLNEVFEGDCAEVGLIVQGGLYNSLVRALHRLGLADAYGRSRLPILVLNVVYPLVPDELARFARGRRAVLVIEEGQPEFIEHEVGSILRRAAVTAAVYGKDVLPMAGEYTSEVLLAGIGRFLRAHAPSLADPGDLAYEAEVAELRKTAADALGHALVEAARRLALWMAYEDVARVACLKSRPDRFRRIRQECGAAPGQIVTVTEYLKPGAEELADILPQAIGRKLLHWARSGRWLPLIGRGLKIRSTGICGNLTLQLLAQFRSLRPGSLRYHEEQLAIEDWLTAMKVALERDSAFAGALAELPRLLKGYGDTHARGRDAYRTVMDSLVRPAIATGAESQAAPLLRRAIATTYADADADLSQLVCQLDPDSVLGRGSAAAEPA